MALGFKVDQPALKSFQEGVTKATKAVVGLAAAVEGTATLVRRLGDEIGRRTSLTESLPMH